MFLVNSTVNNVHYTGSQGDPTDSVGVEKIQYPGPVTLIIDLFKSKMNERSNKPTHL